MNKLIFALLLGMSFYLAFYIMAAQDRSEMNNADGKAGSAAFGSCEIDRLSVVLSGAPLIGDVESEITMELDHIIDNI